MNKHRVALIGGVSSVSDVRAGLPDSCELVGLCDIRENVLRRCREEDSGLLISADYREIAAMPNCDTIATFTPNALHVPISKACLEGGKNVWMEKPIGITLDEGRELLAVEQQSGKHVGVDLEYRYSEMTGQVLKQIIDSGELGKLLHIEYDHYRGGWLDDTPQGAYRTKRATGGMMRMEGIHQIDFFRYLIGDIVAVQSFAAVNALSHYEFPDNLTVMLWFANGARGRYTINHTRSGYSIGHDWEAGPKAGHCMTWGITGTKGSVVMDAWASQIKVFRFEAQPPGTNSLKPEIDRVIDLSVRIDRNALFHDMHGYRNDFLDRMARNAPPYQSLADAYRSETVAVLCDESAYAGGIKIDCLPFQCTDKAEESPSVSVEKNR